MIVAKYYVSEGNTRRLLWESEDDETPQRVVFTSEEAYREPTKSGVYFRSETLLRKVEDNLALSTHYPSHAYNPSEIIKLTDFQCGH